MSSDKDCPKGVPKNIITMDGIHTDKLLMTWDSVTNANTYNVYRSTKPDSDYSLIGNTFKNTFKDTSLVAGTTYYYKISGMKLGCNETELSDYDIGYINPYQSDQIKCYEDKFNYNNISLDSNFNMYYIDVFSGTMDFGGGNRTSNGKQDFYFIKMDSNGVYQWDYTKGGIEDDSISRNTIDSSGNIYLVGAFQETIDFGGGNRTGSYDNRGFIVKLNSSGVYQWENVFSSTTPIYFNNIARSTNGNIYLLGIFEGTINFGGGDRTCPVDQYSLFAIKLDNNGVYQWDYTKIIDYPLINLRVDNNDNVYIAGSFRGVINFGSGIIVSEGDFDDYIVKLNSNGTFQWVYTYGGNSDDILYDIEIDSNSNVLTTGMFQDCVNFGGGERCTIGAPCVYLVKLSSNGVFQWDYTTVEYITEGHNEEGRNVTIDTNGDIYIAGVFEGYENFGGGKQETG